MKPRRSQKNPQISLNREFLGEESASPEPSPSPSPNWSGCKCVAVGTNPLAGRF